MSLKNISFSHFRAWATIFFYTGIYVYFLLYLATFSFSYYLRDYFNGALMVSIIPFYLLAYRHSALYVFDAKKYFISFYIFLVLGIIFSQNIEDSFIKVSVKVGISLIVPFAAMEAVRSVRYLYYVIWILIAVLIVQGLDGIYQYFNGFDLIHNTPIISGRLTGAFRGYNVGNFVALTIIPAISILFILRTKCQNFSFILTGCLLFPALFLMFFSYTRNAYITLFFALFLWCLVVHRFPWKLCLVLGGSFGLLTQIPALRLNWERISADGRWDLWGLAVEVFQEFPFLGAGIGQYNSAFRSLGLEPIKDIITISHPHNIYLQFLCENGIIGAFFALLFLFGMFWWAYKKLHTISKRDKILLCTADDSIEKVAQKTAWYIATLFWCGWGAFLASGIVGHNFFQRWWHTLVLTYLGIMIAIIINILSDKKEHVNLLDNVIKEQGLSTKEVKIVQFCAICFILFAFILLSFLYHHYL